MPSKAIQIERMVKRVDNAIHNPSIDYKGVKAALADLKAASIRPYREDYDHWIRLAIDAKDERKLCCLFGSTQKSALLHLLENGQAYLPMYVNSSMFNPNFMPSYYYRHDYDICGLLDNGPALTLFFQQPKSWPILKRLEREPGFRKYFTLNPVFKRRKYLAKVLLRFWLLTTKPLLRSWRESLYIPGTGALYKKAAAAFEASIHKDRS